MLLARLGGTEGNIAGQYCEKELSLRKEYAPEVLKWYSALPAFLLTIMRLKQKQLMNMRD